MSGLPSKKWACPRKRGIQNLLAQPSPPTYGQRRLLSWSVDRDGCFAAEESFWNNPRVHANGRVISDCFPLFILQVFHFFKSKSPFFIWSTLARQMVIMVFPSALSFVVSFALYSGRIWHMLLSFLRPSSTTVQVQLFTSNNKFELVVPRNQGSCDTTIEVWGEFRRWLTDVVDIYQRYVYPMSYRAICALVETSFYHIMRITYAKANAPDFCPFRCIVSHTIVSCRFSFIFRFQFVLNMLPVLVLVWMQWHLPLLAVWTDVFPSHVPKISGPNSLDVRRFTLKE